MLPAQLINVYLGSSLRSMQDVLEDRSTAATGYIIFCMQVRLYVSVKKFTSKVIIPPTVIITDIGGTLINGLHRPKSAKGASVDIVQSRLHVYGKFSSLYSRWFARLQDNLNESNCVNFSYAEIIDNCTIAYYVAQFFLISLFLSSLATSYILFQYYANLPVVLLKI